MTVDKRAPGIGTAFRNFDYERELDRLKRSGGTGSGGGGGGSVAMDPWHTVNAAGEPAFQNSYNNYDAANYPAAAFRKDPLGKVQLRGLLTTGTASASAFTLPVPHRTSRTSWFVWSGRRNRCYWCSGSDWCDRTTGSGWSAGSDWSDRRNRCYWSGRPTRTAGHPGAAGRCRPYRSGRGCGARLATEDELRWSWRGGN
jgi:hypothetical protein